MNSTSLLALVLLTVPVALADDFETQRQNNWHQWRGPDGNGVAILADPPVEWSETRHVKWKTALTGRGSSSPIVWGDKVLITSALGTERVKAAPLAERELPQIDLPEGVPPLTFQPVPKNYYKFLVTAFDRTTGKQLWETMVAEEVPHRAHHMDHGYASSSPTTDGERIYASFGSVGIFCLGMDGDVKWSRDLADLEIPNDFGEVVTPVLHGDDIVVVMDHLGQSFIEILDKRTGKTRWRKDRAEVASWATPLVTEFSGRAQVIVCGSQRVMSYDLKTGEVVWECGGLGKALIPTPVRYKNLVFCMTGYLGDSLQAIRLDSQGDITGTEYVVWRTDKGTPYVPSPALYGGQLYFNRENQPVMTSLKAETGETVIQSARLSQLTGSIYASPVAAAGKIYFFGRDGGALVIEHGPKLQVFAQNKLDDVFDATPALVGREIILRGESSLYCISNE